MQVTLTFTNGSAAGRAITLDGLGRTIFLGRSSGVDLQVPDERASRRHCALKIEEGRVLIADLKSGNGTLVNGLPIVQGVLNHGDRIQIGSTEILVGLAASAPAAPPAFAMPAPPPTPPVPCGQCGAPLAPLDLALGEKWKGKQFCLRCHPAPEIPGIGLERRLGEGAMGAVFMGRDARTGAELAVKCLKIHGAITPEDRARFIREAATSAAIVHPNVVQVLGRGESPTGTLFIVMEFVRGQSLKAIIDARGQLPVIEALSIAGQIASVLEAARERHIVHRDVKPENILVQPDGLAKLTDFGLAKSILQSGLSGLTRPGEGMGTLPYMPPEQIENAVVADHRADIYSLGATLYHMLAGKRPFSAKSNMEFFVKIMEEKPPPITDVRKDVPPPVLRIVDRALQKKPEQRYQAAGEIVREIQALLQAGDARTTTG